MLTDEQQAQLFKDKKLKIEGFKNIYQELMKEVKKKEVTVVFFVGLSRIYWAINDNLLRKLVEILMRLNPHKFLYYCRGNKSDEYSG